MVDFPAHNRVTHGTYKTLNLWRLYHGFFLGYYFESLGSWFRGSWIRNILCCWDNKNLTYGVSVKVNSKISLWVYQILIIWTIDLSILPSFFVGFLFNATTLCWSKPFWDLPIFTVTFSLSLLWYKYLRTMWKKKKKAYFSGSKPLKCY